MSDNLMQDIYSIAAEACEARASWIEAEINKSVIKEGLQDLPLLDQASQLQEKGYRLRQYPDQSVVWGRETKLGCFFIHLAKFEFKYIAEPKTEANDTLAQ